MSNEMRILAFIAICLFLAYVGLVGHVLIKCLKDNPKTKTNSLEGEK